MAKAFERLKARIESKQAVVGVMGLGYVGLPLLAAFHDAGFPVLGFDVDAEKVERLKAGRTYLPHLGPEVVGGFAGSKRFDCTADLSRLREADAILVCVPTPLGKHHEPDLTYVVKTAEAIGRTLRPGQLIILESSTYPGTTRDDMVPAMLGACPGARPEVGGDVFVAFSPEREDPGRTSHSTKTIPKLVGGLCPRSTDLAVALYGGAIAEVIPTSSAEVAEAAKLLENIFRAVNIALVNEMKVVLESMGINVWEVIAAASTKPFGFMPFYPGPGWGGHCIPIDPYYLVWKAKEIGKPARFIELAGEVNREMPHYVVERVGDALSDRGKALFRSRVLVLGLAYKPDIADTRESPSFELIDLLLRRQVRVDYSDPFVKETYPVRRYHFELKSVELTPESVASYDCLLIATNHSAFDYAMIARSARLVVDTRNAMKAYAAEMGDRLVRA
ncbi:MAG: nucleotide sugar dehydrogenase [Phycisphaerae bacterium]|nr:nucleotide sugar dehydrogenase [Phycisphaerae bacterium]